MDIYICMSEKTYQSIKVSQIIDETHDSRSFVFDIPSDQQELFQYEAGQFLTFRVNYDGKLLTRSYSLASSPASSDPHKVTVKRVSGGRISNWFNDHVKVGDTLDVMPPSGRFTLRDHTNQLLMFGGGSGITPIISIIKTALATTSRSIKLFYANRDDQSVIFAEELQSLAKAHPDRLQIVHSLDNKDGYLTAERVRSFVNKVDNADIYMCGPGPFMDVIEQTVQSMGATREQIFLERFVSPKDPDVSDVELEDEEDSTPAGATLTSFVAKWEGTMHHVPYSEGLTILEAANEAGIEPPYSCEEGYCSSCLFQLVKGTVHMKLNDCLSQDDIEHGTRLACQSIPTSSELEIDWDG